MNPRCTYKHAEGQRGNFGDKVWTASGSTSERKFVEDENAPEELVKPEADETAHSQELTA
jgi:hypothetical protein